ncbi:hypothetical protein EBB07_34345 [Paenibacillaceae bacterium]|nr:hypothetical protein EBB07_34345 [Paenibacillaceae bacterium]
MTATAELAIVRSQEKRWEQWIQKHRESIAAGREGEGMGVGSLALLLPLYCHPQSIYYENEELPELLMQMVDKYLATQLPSGCISLVNCNIDSPPDTAFAVPFVAMLSDLAAQSGLPGTAEVARGLETFLERAKPCVLTGGIHTPNHRWVMAGALAKMYERYKDEAFKERAFQFLNEGLDITDYGEWTERSNGVYNGACDLHLYDVWQVFGHQPAYEAIVSNLGMMRYLLHPNDDLVTEYSGRQDRNTPMKMNEWYYIITRLMASRDSAFAGLAAIADRSTPKGSYCLLYHMLHPSEMELPESFEPLQENYTLLLGEHNVTPVPSKVPYRGKLVEHPHGASVLRHRQGKLSMTVMAGQPELLALRWGEARLHALKLGAGWFGVAGVAFPTIRSLGANRYELEIALEGCYWQPLPDELTRSANGRYVDMPNHLREKTHISYLPIKLEVELFDNGVDLTIVSEGINNIYLQAALAFNAAGELSGEGLSQTDLPHIQFLASGEAVYTAGADRIHVSPGALEHSDAVIRNDVPDPSSKNIMINMVTPVRRTIQIRGY